jgi:putative glycerol-1-phosphate prenyltransferase
LSEIYSHILTSKKKPQLAVLVDPDKFNSELIKLADKNNVSYFFVGGSKLNGSSVEKTISSIKKISSKPVVIFPGDEKQVSGKADALLFLSLLSGRNPEYLIGKQVLAAPVIRKKKLTCISTAYLLIGGSKKSTTQKVTGTHPISEKNKTEIVNTALAAEYLGFKCIYLEAGSGSDKAIPSSVIRQVKKNVSVPLLVGGGIDTAARAKKAINSGADIIIVGNALEKNIFLINQLSSLFQ